MDPNAALENAREAARGVIEAIDNGNIQALDVSASNLAEAFQALDTWLLRGGFKPDAWQ